MSIVLFVIQLVLFVILTFGDIGFDHPGRFGMSFGHGVVLTALYVIIFLAGLICSAAENNWRTAILQIAIPLMIAAFLFWPSPHYSADDYQHLVGKSRAEVEAILSDRNTITGMEGRGGKNYDFTSYDGMTVIYNPEGVVYEVQADNAY